MHKVIVIGGGAAGMMAALTAAKKGNQVTLLEKNEKLGKKIYITGKGRCNLTNNCSNDDFFKNVVTNPKFLFSAINSFNPSSTMELFESLGLSLKTERGDRVFPASDKASDVTKTLENELYRLGVDISLNTKVNSLIIENGKVVGVKTEICDILCDSVIVATGGISYPTTGSDGDGYKFAKLCGHTIKPLIPSLVGIELESNEHKELQGLSLKNVNITARRGDKTIYSDFGEMLFTHYGVSGPIILSTSCFINKYQPKEISLSIDLKPALNEKTLEDRLLRDFKENNTKSILSVIRGLVPKNMVELIARRSNIYINKNCSQITQEERTRLINTLKNLLFKVNKLRPIEEAVVTSGGVNVKEINPKTMESKLINGLFFAGEVIDVDAFTGGFNLQIAFSTGYAAGNNA